MNHAKENVKELKLISDRTKAYKTRTAEQEGLGRTRERI